MKDKISPNKSNSNVNINHEIKINSDKKSDKFKHNLEDKLMKQLSERGINVLLKRLNIPIKIVKRLNTELILDNLELRLDFLGLTEDNQLVNIEFQSTKLKTKDKEKIGSYALLARIKEQKYIDSIIISTPHLVEKNSFNYHINKNCVFEIHQYNLKDEDGDKIQEKLVKKVENNEKFSEEDICDFILCPLMFTKRKIEDVIEINVNLLRKINTSSENLDFISSMMFLIISKFVNDNKKQEYLWRELKMKISLIDKICDTMFKEGIEKGIENNKIEIAKDMIKKNYSEEEIISITKITKEQLLTLLKL